MNTKCKQQYTNNGTWYRSIKKKKCDIFFQILYIREEKFVVNIQYVQS